MSRTRIVKGTYTKISAKGHNMFSNENIITIAGIQVREEGVENGLFLKSPQKPPETPYNDEPDFDIKLELIKDDFVPLGIPNYKGEPENDKVKFKLIITGNGVNQWDLKIKSGDQLVYELFSGTREIEEVVIKYKKEPGSPAKSKRPIEPEEEPLTPIKRYWPKGEYIISWDGFDINNIYDSALMKSDNGLTVNITGQAEFKKKSFAIEKPIKFTHKKVDWVDVKIDGNNFKIDTTLRVNLKDGGEEGLKSWNKISKEALTFYNKAPITVRARSYEDLEELTIQGINQFWSRNSENIGGGVQINSEIYEVNVAAQSNRNGMAAPSIIYQTNRKTSRSRNFEASRKLFFYEGYLYNDSWKESNPSSAFYKNKGWIYRSENFVEEKNVFLNPQPLMEDYKMTAAHEIGHEILLAFGGHSYSKAHKGTSHWSLIIQNPDKDATFIRSSGEIDLMKYYHDYYDIKRTIVSEFDLLRVIWLSKIKIN